MKPTIYDDNDPLAVPTFLRAFDGKPSLGILDAELAARAGKHRGAFLTMPKWSVSDDNTKENDDARPEED